MEASLPTEGFTVTCLFASIPAEYCSNPRVAVDTANETLAIGRVHTYDFADFAGAEIVGHDAATDKTTVALEIKRPEGTYERRRVLLEIATYTESVMLVAYVSRCINANGAGEGEARVTASALSENVCVYNTVK